MSPTDPLILPSTCFDNVAILKLLKIIIHDLLFFLGFNTPLLALSFRHVISRLPAAGTESRNVEDKRLDTGFRQYDKKVQKFLTPLIKTLTIDLSKQSA